MEQERKQRKTNGEAHLPPPDPRDIQIERMDQMITLMRHELQQYRNDLVFWQRAHGAEYPVRRLQELDIKIAEINSL
jgi:hypothetical protein